MPTPIHCISPQEGLEVVGVTKSLLGDSSTTLKVLQKKANSWQEILRSKFLPCSLLCIPYFMFCGHSVCQVLPPHKLPS